jgi:succinyl-diaminopimelate desuccinylase
MDRHATKNLWARRGTQAPLFCFAGHVDVVPPGPLAAWKTPPFQPVIENGFLRARGAADMKSAIAAMLAATRDFITARPDHPGSLAFLLTSDEEGDALDGTQAVVDALAQRGETLDFCLVGEPTATTQVGDTIKIGRRGSLSGKLRVLGTQCHIAYPERGQNPIHALAPLLAELTTTSWDTGAPHFQPTAWQASNLHAGMGANNVIPGLAELAFNFRYAPTSTPEDLQRRFVALLEKHGLACEIDWTLGAQPFLTEPGPLATLAREAIAEETGRLAEYSTTGGTSDGRFLRAISREIIELGLENTTSHQIDEAIAIESLTALTGIYRRLLDKLLCPA